MCGLELKFDVFAESLICLWRLLECPDVIFSEVDFIVLVLAQNQEREDLQLSNPSPRSLTLSGANVVAIHVLPRT